MALYITSLNSGSNGNCYYIANETDAIFIDAGISCRETEKRMRRLNLSMSKVRAIFISHEHSDHIRGVTVLSKKYRLPVYMTATTLQSSGLKFSDGTIVMPFNTQSNVQIGSLSIKAFAKNHDAADPHSFLVSCDNINIGIFTDIGIPCEQLIYHFQQCHAAFLESNYDEDMLENGRYPIFLKNRIRGGKGHLSNTQALHIFRTYRPAHMSHLLLSHLSKDNNNPELVEKIFKEHSNGTEIIVASRFNETNVLQIIESLNY